MFDHHHPYPPFIPEKATRLIIGTIPPPRFSASELFPEDVHFCYGSKHGQFWPIMDAIYDLNLNYRNDRSSVIQRKKFLTDFGIGICDLVERCQRAKRDASDLGMQNIITRDLVAYLKTHKRIETLLFMGGNSKNGPEYLFRRHLKKHGIQLEQLISENPRIHQFDLEERTIRTISLVSPSNAANRSIGANPIYKSAKLTNEKYTTLQFRIDQYRRFFT
jgi:G:T/U-mismatch repair DNA glycosylase